MSATPVFAPFGRLTVQPGLVTMFSFAAPVSGLTASKDSIASDGAGCWALYAATTEFISSASASAPTPATIWASVYPASGVPGVLGLGSARALPDIPVMTATVRAAAPMAMRREEVIVSFVRGG